MQKFLLIGAVLAVTAVSLPARADDEVVNPPAYVEADLGHASLDRSGVSTFAGQSSGISGTTVTGSLLGGYFFTDNFGAELGYHDFGKPGAFVQTGVFRSECSSGAFSCPQVSGFSAMLLGKMEVVPNLDGILRLGVLSWNVGSPGGQLLDKTSGQTFLYGIGVRRRFEGGWGLVISYERSSFTTEETRIGVSWSF
jgi:hypothetical protein